MSALIKKMLAERRALADAERAPVEDAAERAEVDHAMRLVDLAKPFIDEHAGPDKWPPSCLLRIGYCVLSTGDNPESGLAFLERHLEIARQRFREGLDPNPFLGRPA